MSVTLKNASGSILKLLVPTHTGSQDTINLAVDASQVFEDSVISRAHGVYAQVADGKLTVTAGAMPTEVFTDVPAPQPRSIKGALAVAADATDLASAQTLVNELKGILNTMNA